MKIGYSMWGFLGSGIVDTPDGSRSYRRPMVDALIAAGHEVVFLQHNRDLFEARVDLRDRYVWHTGFPDLDALLLEWRWPLPERNTTVCGSPGHTCDLHQQTELVDYYTRARYVPTVVWDLDRQLPADDLLRVQPSAVVCEFALRPTPGATTLVCPVPDAALDGADPAALAARPRPVSLVYVGNQYDRDTAFNDFLAPAARRLNHLVAGKWPRTEAWPHVNFTGRCAFDQVASIHGRALATVLLLPDRYAQVGQDGRPGRTITRRFAPGTAPAPSSRSSTWLTPTPGSATQPATRAACFPNRSIIHPCGTSGCSRWHGKPSPITPKPNGAGRSC